MGTILKKIISKTRETAWAHLVKHFGLNDSDLIERQRLAIFLLSELGMVLIGIASTILYKDERNLFFYINNCIFIVLPIVLFVLYNRGIFSLSRALFWHLILYQAIASSKIIYAGMTTSNPPLANGIIIIDMTLLLTCLLIAYMSHIKYVNIIIIVSSLITYIAAIIITDSFVLENFLPVFCIMFVLYGFFAHIMNHMLSANISQNNELKAEHEILTTRFEKNQKTLEALLSLTSEQQIDKHQIKVALAIVGSNAEKNLRRKMRYVMEQEQIDYDKLETRLPELSQSEIAICDMILKGKKLVEICKELDKTETNISSQRSHIRTKLGLSSNDNLKTALEMRMKRK